MTARTTNNKQMRLKIIFTIATTILFLNANAQNKSNYIKKENLNKDFDFLVSAITETHPNPYSVISKNEFDSKIAKIKENFKDSLTLKEYYRMIAPLVASLKDGHTSLKFPGRKLYNETDNLFPFIIKSSLEKPFLSVTENLNSDYSQIPVGAEILKINDIPAEKIIQKIIENTSGESNDYRLKMGADFYFFGFVFGAFYDLKDTAVVEYIFENKIYKKSIPTVTLSNLMEIIKKKKNQPSNQPQNVAFQDFSLILKPEIKTAIFDIRYFNDETKFQDFLSESFKKIKIQKINKIVIDIRENGGGNSTLGDELLKYITSKPFKQFDNTTIKYSQLQKDFYKDYCESDTLKNCNTYNYIKTKKNGEMERFPVENLTEPYPKSERFDGKVYLLTSVRTFSSASSFAQAFKHYKIGKIVGQETGGWIVSYGDKIMSELPITKIPLSVSTKKFYTVGTTDEDLHGVKPDIEMKAENALDFIIKNK